MSQGERTFDPDSARQFIEFLNQEVELIEDTILPHYFADGGSGGSKKTTEGGVESGTLSRMPAFGTGAGAELAEHYRLFHQGAWRDLQGLLSTYRGFIEALEATIEAIEESETVTTQNFDNLNWER